MKLQVSPAVEAAALALGEAIAGGELPEVIAELIAEGYRHQIHRTRFTPAAAVTHEDMARANEEQVEMWLALRSQITEILKDEARLAVKFYNADPKALGARLGVHREELTD